MEPVMVKVLELKKKIAKQMEKKSSVSRIEYEIIAKNPSMILGWVWSEDVDWRTGRIKVLVVKFGELDYKLIPYYDNFSVFSPKQIFLT